ncbi:MAG: Slp family lipoprotein [Deltaproteobacteria bacterium]|nr:Slp family lipoprotein [Deltaproteobacteria bacterium]
MQKFLFMILSVLLLSACGPAISKTLLSQADPALTFPDLLKDPEKYRGRIVVLWGEILETSTRNGETWIEVLQRPLDWRQKPRETDLSSGRFLLHDPEFRDPAVYARGRRITVAGEVEGKRAQSLKEMQYAYPVIRPRESHLWSPESMGGPFFHLGIGVGVYR